MDTALPTARPIYERGERELVLEKGVYEPLERDAINRVEGKYLKERDRYRRVARCWQTDNGFPHTVPLPLLVNIELRDCLLAVVEVYTQELINLGPRCPNLAEISQSMDAFLEYLLGGLQ